MVADIVQEATVIESTAGSAEPTMATAEPILITAEPILITTEPIVLTKESINSGPITPDQIMLTTESVLATVGPAAERADSATPEPGAEAIPAPELSSDEQSQQTPVMRQSADFQPHIIHELRTLNADVDLIDPITIEDPVEDPEEVGAVANVLLMTRQIDKPTMPIRHQKSAAQRQNIGQSQAVRPVQKVTPTPIVAHLHEPFTANSAGAGFAANASSDEDLAIDITFNPEPEPAHRTRRTRTARSTSV